MTKREFKIGHIGEKTQILENIIDKNNFSMKIQRIKNNNYGLFINNQKIESYEVPADDIKLIKIGAWADDYYYKIKFNNIECEG